MNKFTLLLVTVTVAAFSLVCSHAQDPVTMAAMQGLAEVAKNSNLSLAMANAADLSAQVRQIAENMQALVHRESSSSVNIATLPRQDEDRYKTLIFHYHAQTAAGVAAKELKAVIWKILSSVTTSSTSLAVQGMATLLADSGNLVLSGVARQGQGQQFTDFAFTDDHGEVSLAAMVIRRSMGSAQDSGSGPLFDVGYHVFHMPSFQLQPHMVVITHSKKSFWSTTVRDEIRFFPKGVTSNTVQELLKLVHSVTKFQDQLILDAFQRLYRFS